MNKARKFAGQRLGRFGRWIGSKVALAAILAAGLGLFPEGAHRGRAVAGTPLTIGFIYVGPKDDYGYNQAHAEGAAASPSCPA